MRVAQPVHIAPYFTDELAGFVELQQLRGGIAVQRAGSAAAGMVHYQDVALGIHRHRQHFPEIHVG
jgi:hypothetical protein